MDKKRFNLKKAAMIVACFTVITMFASCEKDNPDTNTGDVKLLDTETIGLYNNRRFMYDNKHRLKEIWRLSGGEVYEKAFITYTGEDLTKLEYAYLVEGEFVVMDTRNYVKNGNTISFSMAVELIEGEGEKEGSYNIISTITLNNDGFPDKIEEELLGMSWVIYYTYVNGNLTNLSSVEKGYGSEETRETNYTYATQRSAYSGCNTPKWFMFLHFKEDASHNSLKEYTYEIIDARGYKFVWTKTYEYVYDSDEFPTKCTANNMFGEQVIIEFKYQN